MLSFLKKVIDPFPMGENQDLERCNWYKRLKGEFRLDSAQIKVAVRDYYRGACTNEEINGGLPGAHVLLNGQKNLIGICLFYDVLCQTQFSHTVILTLDKKLISGSSALIEDSGTEANFVSFNHGLEGLLTFAKIDEVRAVISKEAKPDITENEIDIKGFNETSKEKRFQDLIEKIFHNHFEVNGNELPNRINKSIFICELLALKIFYLSSKLTREDASEIWQEFHIRFDNEQASKIFSNETAYNNFFEDRQVYFLSLLNDLELGDTCRVIVQNIYYQSENGQFTWYSEVEATPRTLIDPFEVLEISKMFIGEITSFLQWHSETYST